MIVQCQIHLIITIKNNQNVNASYVPDTEPKSISYDFSLRCILLGLGDSTAGSMLYLAQKERGICYIIIIALLHLRKPR